MSSKARRSARNGNGGGRRAAGRSGKIGYAVVGLGYIAQAAVMPAFAHAKRNSRLVALVSDDPGKRAALSRRYRVPHAYDYAGYAECLENPDVQAVYIALPNHLHREYAIAAARAGKHVLCEKPLAVTERDCEAMIEAAEKNGVLLMTAYRLHFEKASLKAAEIVRGRRLGEPRLFHSVFSMQVGDDNVRLGPTALGGGPIYDIGIYCINAARALFADEPVEAFAWSATGSDDRFGESPEAMGCLLRFGGDRLASFVCSFGAADAGWYQVVGTRGDLRVDPAYEYAEPLTHRLTIEGKTRESRFAKRDQFGPELVHFSDCILERRQPEPSGREGLADVRIIRALLKSADSGRTVKLSPVARRRRPTMAQEMRRRPVEMPELVHAEAPSGG
jgi:predicted dehydrogenase